MEPAEPILSLAIGPKTPADQEKLGLALATLMAEHPFVCVTTDAATGTVVISGTTETQLAIIVGRLVRHFQVEVNVARVQVLYKETVTRAADANIKYLDEVDGRRHYAHVKIALYPGERGSGYVFESTASGAIPALFVSSVDVGIRGALMSGVLRGHPVDDVRVELFDGSYHDVDSSDAGFRIAGAIAFREAAKKAGPVVLEPAMRVEVLTPGDHAGNVIAVLLRRRAQIRSHEPRAGTLAIVAHVPAAELFGFAADLRLRTQGRASYTMQFAGYQVRPEAPPRDDVDEDDRTSSVIAPFRPPTGGRNDAIALPRPAGDGWWDSFTSP